MAAKVVTSAECQATSLGSALRRAVAKVKDRKNDFKLQAEKVGKAKESLAEERAHPSRPGARTRFFLFEHGSHHQYRNEKKLVTFLNKK